MDMVADRAGGEPSGQPPAGLMGGMYGVTAKRKANESLKNLGENGSALCAQVPR